MVARQDETISSGHAVLPWPPAADCHAIPESARVGQRGITCRQFQELTRFIKRLCRTGLLRYTSTYNTTKEGERMLWTEITMFHVCYNVIKPVMEHLGQELAWSTLVNQGREQMPKIFISHSWEEHFVDFCSTFQHVKLDRGLTATDVVWICTFANNQFRLDLGARLSQSPFYGALEYVNHVALFLDHTASALSRSWCNFELAITTDNPENRQRWKIRKEIAKEQNCTVFQVDWSEVDIRILQLGRMNDSSRHQQEEEDGSDNKSQRQLLLVTPAGMVGTQRVTSGPVLKALATLKSARAEAFHDADRRRIMNHIAYNYLADKEEQSPAEDQKTECIQEHEGEHELIGLEKQNGKLVLSSGLESSDRRRLNGKPDYVHEYNLTSRGEQAERFKMLDESIFVECSKALERRGAPPPKGFFCRHQNEKNGNGLTKVATRDFRKWESGLTLCQIRSLEVLLRAAFEQSKIVVDGKELEWKDCTSRHLFSTEVQKEAIDGNHHWEGLAAAFMPQNATYAECVNQHPTIPEFYVINSWETALVDVFKAIEWHAEALGLSDRTIYYIHGFSLLSVEDDPGEARLGYTEDIMPFTTEGVLLLANERLSKRWSEDRAKQSLWCFYELWSADQFGLPWDIACSSGILATTRPFANSKWEVGTFNPKIAENLARMSFDAEMAWAHSQDRAMILDRIQSSPGGIPKFNETVTARLSMRMLAPYMRHAAYMDNGMASLEALNEALRLLAKHRCKFYLNLLTFRGGFGESPLHILAARRDLGKPGFSDGHATMLALIHAGFNVNDQCDEGETPLHWAAFAGAEWTTTFLLRHGANPMIASFTGELPLQVAQARPAEFLHKDASRSLEMMLQAAMLPWQNK
ncbi:Ankyrin repeat [Seminavis robusta]|uniref:Ankyrin repeat n=1 Tax=Seminavis robusta TaxID=568900 RepID=A0A9N8ECV1_9STRA|nr:Ankyrin repeat [Seminavis robusta]|eukprot:Sro811_g205910.1 Ankyrin repeat (867) ;mRNA; r:16139-18739